ncbi:MAG: hypothetical protein JXR83_06565, partial [Deltaproteobacteria bacterium]|nr:hypothetical protein [Deltaproteobacteria bacterium]
MSFSLRLLLVGLALGSASSGCSFDTSVGSDGEPLPTIVCDEDAECPPGWLCNPTLGRCIPIAQRDSVVPGLDGEPALTPAIGGVGRLFNLAFKVTEALAEDPTVELDVGNGRMAGWIVDESATDRSALGYAFRYTATGSEQEGVRLVTVDLVDRSGNAVDNLSAGSLELDFTPPRIVLSTLTPGIAGAGTAVELYIELSEPVPAPPAVVLLDGEGDSHTFAHVAASGALGHSYAFTPTGQEREGLYLARAIGADAAGNLLDEPQVAKLVLDFTAPAISATRVVPEVATVGQRVLVEIDLSEELAHGALLAATASNAATHFYSEQGGTSTRLRFEHTVASGTDGHYQLELRDLFDLAGNATPALVVGSVEYDSTPPVLSELTTDAAHYSAQAGHDLITVTFDIGEPLANGRLEVWIGDRLFTCSSYQPSSPRYTCTYQVQGYGVEPEGLAIVSVRALDAAGNESVAGAPIRLDFTPPVVRSAHVSYEPAPDCPLITVARATVGSEIILASFASEEIDASVPATLTLDCGGLSLALALPAASQDSGSATFSLRVPDGFDFDGDCTPQIEWTDLVGNSNPAAGFDSPRVQVKTSIPVMLVDQAAVRYLRSPWGNGAAEDLGGFTMPAGAYFALAPAETLSSQETLPATAFALVAGRLPLVQVWADSQRQSLVGWIKPNDDGSWPRQRLANLDTPAVHVSGVDDACNLTDLVKIENSEWVATPKPPAFGSSPNLLQQTSRVEPSLDQDPRLVQRVGDESWAVDGNSLLVRATAKWVHRDPSTESPPTRSGTTMAYDSSRGRIVMFGGTDSGYLQDTWEWDGQSWTDVTPYSSPPARWGAAMVYDSRRGCVVLFSGSNERLLGDTWEWDGTSWTEVTPAAGNPPPRNLHAMAYDSTRGRVVLFGGEVISGISILQDTWEWDGQSWTEVTPAAGNPPPRDSHAMAFDSAQSRVVLFGGSNWSETLQDTWIWDGHTWTEVTPATPPTARTGCAMAYDSTRRRIVLFGGYVLGNPAQDTWEWDGTNWSEVATNRSPPIRGNHAMAYDSARDRVVLFGGIEWYFPMQDTWVFDEADWTEIKPAAYEIPTHYGPVMVYDSARDRIVLFGGHNDLQDTWEWDGNAWIDVTPDTGNPPARHEHAMAYDRVRGRTVMFGGRVGSERLHDTWEWDGQYWEEVTPGTGNPPARETHAMVFDSLHGRIVMFGGLDAESHSLQDTWEWDGFQWQEMTPGSANPAARRDHAMAYDWARGRVVLFGGWGNAYLQDTWEWDGHTWVELTPETGNPAGRD